MRGNHWFILLVGLAIIFLANSVGITRSSFFDTETSTGTFQAWTSQVWVQTTQADFNAGVLDNVDTSSSPGDVKLAYQSAGIGINWFLNSDSKVYTPSTGSWQDVNLSGDSDIPAGATGVVLEIINEESGMHARDHIGQVRAKGSTDDQKSGARIRAETQIMAFVKLDANKKFQAYRDSAYIRFYVRGYTDSNVTFFTNWSNVYADSTINVWHTVDVSGYGVPANSIIMLELYDHNGQLSSSDFRLRRNGDTAYSPFSQGGTSAAHQYVMVGVDANSRFQHWRNINDYAKMHLVGYIQNVGTWKSSPSEDVSGSSIGSWVDRDITSETSGNAKVAFVRVSNTSSSTRQADLRKNGSSDDKYAYGQHRLSSASSIFYVVGLDDSQVFETKIEISYIDIFVLGYTESSSAYVSPGTIASQVLDTLAGARWNALFWDRTLETGTITFEVRAADSLSGGFPDASWILVGGSSPVTSGLPPGRYMQWRATLTTSDTSKTPILHEVRVYYY